MINVIECIMAFIFICVPVGIYFLYMRDKKENAICDHIAKMGRRKRYNEYLYKKYVENPGSEIEEPQEYKYMSGGHFRIPPGE